MWKKQVHVLIVIILLALLAACSGNAEPPVPTTAPVAEPTDAPVSTNTVAPAEPAAEPETEDVSLGNLLVPEGEFKETYFAPFPVNDEAICALTPRHRRLK